MTKVGVLMYELCIKDWFMLITMLKIIDHVILGVV